MPKTPDSAILAALEIYDSAGDVAMETCAPMRQVIHLQRLYGPYTIQEQRRTEDRASLAAAQERAQGHRNGHGLRGAALKQALPRQRSREVQLVPDDRRDEEIDFELFMNALAGGIAVGGRGVA